MNKKATLFIILLLSVFSCKKAEEEVPSSIPTLVFEKLEVNLENDYLDSVKIYLSYTDKESDLGYKTIDSNPPPDFLLSLFRKENGVFKKLDSSVYNTFFYGWLPYVASKIPSIHENGPFRVTIKSRYRGEILYRVVLVPPPNSEDKQDIQPGDTLHFEIQTMDQAKNLSNKVTTSDFIFFNR